SGHCRKVALIEAAEIVRAPAPQQLSINALSDHYQPSTFCKRVCDQLHASGSSISVQLVPAGRQGLKDLSDDVSGSIPGGRATGLLRRDPRSRATRPRPAGLNHCTQMEDPFTPSPTSPSRSPV